MNPSGFDGQNCVLGPPRGIGEAEVSSLNVYCDGEQVISCWRPTSDELAEINRTGRVWLRISGPTMPPASVEGHDPFVPQEGRPR